MPRVLLEHRVWSFGAARRLGDVVRAARSAGLRVVLVQVPWREEYVVAADRGAEVGLRKTDFVDYGHMTEAGGARYAAWLAARLRAIGVVAGRDGR